MQLDNFDALSDARTQADSLVAQLSTNPGLAFDLKGDRSEVMAAVAEKECGWTCLWTCAWTSSEA